MREQIETDDDLFRSIERTGPGFYLATGLLIAVGAFAFTLYVRQILIGLGVTGLAQPVSWGFCIVNFVFFIGISHARA